MSAEVGVLGFHSIPQTSVENLSWTEVRRQLGTHFCFKVPEGDAQVGMSKIDLRAMSWAPVAYG